MKKTLLLLILACSIPAGAFAQNECPDCNMRIFDSLAMMQNFGTVPTGAPKDIYVAMQYGAGAPIAGISGAEFSVSGINSALLIVVPSGLNNPTVVLGDVEAPVDTTSGTGGTNVAWAACQNGDLAFMKIQLVALAAVPDNSVYQILRKFPSSNPNFQAPLGIQCDSPTFTKRLIVAGCFVANPNPPNPANGTVIDGCTIISTTAVTSKPWGGVKSLYQ